VRTRGLRPAWRAGQSGNPARGKVALHTRPECEACGRAATHAAGGARRATAGPRPHGHMSSRPGSGVDGRQRRARWAGSFDGAGPPARPGLGARGRESRIERAPPSASSRGSRPVYSRASRISPRSRMTTPGARATPRWSAAAASLGTGTPFRSNPRRARPGSGSSSTIPRPAGGSSCARCRASHPPVTSRWLAEHFLRGRFHATFRVRGAAGAPGPLATLEVLRHFPVGGFDLVGVRDWAHPCSDALRPAGQANVRPGLSRQI
jgi:hypothetical protein